MTIGLISTPIPRIELSQEEVQFNKAFFQISAQTYLQCLNDDDFKYLWEVEKINQGLLYLASSLQKHGYSTIYYCLTNDPNKNERKSINNYVDDICKDLNMLEIVCFYSITCNFHIAVEIATELKKRKPDILIGIGGPHASNNPFQVLSIHFKDKTSKLNKSINLFDFIGVGEGENTIIEIADCYYKQKELYNVPGIYMIKNNMVFFTGQRQRIKYIKFPIPAYKLANIKRLPAARIYPNRGCPNKCDFCADPWIGKVSPVEIDLILEEISYLTSVFKTKYLYLGCEDFFYNKKRALEIALAIHSTFPNIQWTGQCRVINSPSKKYFDILKRNGCISLEFGIESSSSHILKVINKNIKYSDALDCLETTKSVGLYSHAYWMIGLPGESDNSAYRTQNEIIRLARKKLIDTWEYKIYFPYPGTKIFENPKEYDVRILTYDYSKYHYCNLPVIDTGELRSSEIYSIHKKGLKIFKEIMEANIQRSVSSIGVDLFSIENLF